MSYKKIKIKIYATILIIPVIICGFFYFWFFVKSSADKGHPSSAYHQSHKSIYLDINGLDFIAVTKASTVESFLEESQIDLTQEDYIFPDFKKRISHGSQITIKQKIPVKIFVDGQTIELKTFSDKVSQAIEEAQISLNKPDIIEPSLDSKLSNNQEITITRVNIEEIEKIEKIDFETIEKEDSDLAWKKTKVSQKGEYGQKKTVYKIIYENGKEVSREEISSEIIKEPVNKIVAHGTKMELGKASKGQASWYAYTATMACASLEHPKGTWLKVTNTDNGKSVVVVVNDSGPYVEGRIIDLDKVAFEKIGNLGQGVINVKVEKIKNQ
ncbi:MAG: DUF348 domain-containing protein [Candidatus Moranbacteria bacterium]|nr:DUF348 domain-containing protein [Candidatus Moranbacteria bacterium]